MKGVRLNLFYGNHTTSQKTFCTLVADNLSDSCLALHQKDKTYRISILLIFFSSNIIPFQVSQLPKTNIAISKNENVLLKNEPVPFVSTPTFLHSFPYSSNNHSPLCDYGQVELEGMPRMAKFVRFATAAETGLDFSGGALADSMHQRQLEAQLHNLDIDPVAPIIIRWFEDAVGVPKMTRLKALQLRSWNC